jgi:hypothetical protein
MTVGSVKVMMQDVRAGGEVGKIALGAVSERAQRSREMFLTLCKIASDNTNVLFVCADSLQPFSVPRYTNGKFYRFSVLLGDFFLLLT